MVNRKEIAGVALFIILVGAAYFISQSNSTKSLFCTGCAPTSAAIGGTVTSLQNVEFVSNYAGLNGNLYLTTFTINGKGQSLNGTQAQIAKGINSSYQTQTNNPIAINYALNNEELQIPYGYSGSNLYAWGLTPESIGFSSPTITSCPFGLSCSQSYSAGGINYTFAIAAAVGSTPYSTIQTVVGQFETACANSGALNPITLYNAQSQGSLGFTNGESLTLECVAPVQNKIGQVLQPSQASLIVNTTITFTNTTAKSTIYLNSSTPQAYYPISNPTFFAQIYGYSSSGRNIPTSYPSVVKFTNGTNKVVNPLPTSGALTASQSTYSGQFPTGWQQANLQLVTNIGNVYSGQYLRSQINEQNQNLNNYLYAPQNTSLSNIAFNAGTNTGYINMTQDPVYYPEVQLLAKLTTLGVYIPVAKPVIKSVAPNPTNFQSGSQQSVTFSVFNNATAPSSVSISGACGSSSFSSPSVNIGSGATVPIIVLIQSPNNPNQANTSVNCEATATSSSYGLFSNSISWGGSVAPNCPTGYIYQNARTCQPIKPTLNNTNQTNVCADGYNYQNGVCVPVNVCPTGYSENTMTTPPHCQPIPVQNNSIGLGWYILGGIVVVIIIVVLATKGGRTGRGRPHGGSKRKGIL